VWYKGNDTYTSPSQQLHPHKTHWGVILTWQSQQTLDLFIFNNSWYKNWLGLLHHITRQNQLKKKKKINH